MPPPAGTPRCDGHDFADIARALAEALADPRPSLIACRTVIGKGAPNKQGTHNVHGAPLGADEIAATRAGAGLDSPRRSKFLPKFWPTGARWARKGAASPCRMGSPAGRRSAKRPNSSRRMAGEVCLPQERCARLSDGLIAEPAQGRDPQGHRNGAGRADRGDPRTGGRLGRPDRIEPHQDQGHSTAVQRRQLCGPLCLLRHPRIRHGGRDERHGAARRRDSLWRHLPGLLRLLPQRDPHVGDPARRASIYVLTHDRIGLGEDGPTHQPVEHVMSLRAIPNLLVFRPADAIETAECWALALEQRRPPVGARAVAPEPAATARSTLR